MTTNTNSAQERTASIDLEQLDDICQSWKTGVISGQSAMIDISGLVEVARRSLTSGAPADLKYLTRYGVGGDGELQEMVCGDAYLVKDVEELFTAVVHDAAAPSACHVPRYKLVPGKDREWMTPAEDGAWVRWDHHVAAMPAGAAAKTEQLAGRIVSVDVSTGDDDVGNRIFAELTGETGSDGTTLLAIETSRNFTAAGAGSAQPEAPSRYPGQEEASTQTVPSTDATVINYGTPVDKSDGAAGTVEKDAARYRMLIEGEPIELTDEFLSSECTSWECDPTGIFVGCFYGTRLFKPARRKVAAIEAHNKAGKEQG